MINGTTVSSIDEYANDQSAAKERPGVDPVTGDDYYAQGVKPGYSAPAKWWNWLFNALTKRVGEERDDLTVLINELKALLTEAGITVDATSNSQVLAAVLAILSRVATNANPGMVRSSDVDGQVQVLSSGLMQVNGIGDFSDLPSAVAGAYTLVDAIDILYTQLINLSTGVPPQPSTYDADNPVLDTTQLSGQSNEFLGAIYLDAGWYYIDLAGGAGGDTIAYSQIEGGSATIVHTLRGGYGLRATGWVFVMSPGEYWYGVGRGGGHTIVNFASNPPDVTVGDGGDNRLGRMSCTSPSYLKGVAGTTPASVTTSNVSQSTAGTGGATILFSGPTQEAYSVAGGSGGAWGVQNYVTLVTAKDGSSTDTYTSGETEPAQQKPWLPFGWVFQSDDRPAPAVIDQDYPGQTPESADGWIKIYKGNINLTPST